MPSDLARWSLVVIAAAALMGLAWFGIARSTDKDVALPDPVIDAPLHKSAGANTAVVAGGCFWGIQAVFQRVNGVISATSGYSGGDAGDANYAAVSSGVSGHAESVKIVFDPSQVSYGQLLKVFFSVAHDPTQLDRQGPDTGTQYRSAIFYASDEQQRIASAYIEQLERAKVFPRRIVTRNTALAQFYPAEGYHQDYVTHHPHDMYVMINDLPKLAQLKAKLPSLYRADMPK